MLKRTLTVATAAAVPLLAFAGATQAATSGPAHHTAHVAHVAGVPFPLSSRIVDHLSGKGKSRATPTPTPTPTATATGGTGNTGTGDSITITNPGPTSTPLDVNVSLQIQGSSSTSEALTWSQTGLPPTLQMSTSGLITGPTTKAGTYNVTVSATDSSGSTASASFTWTVVPFNPFFANAGALPNTCMDDHHGSTVNGNKIDVWACNFTGAQLWAGHKDGTLHLSLGGCLTDPKSGGDKTGLVISTCQDSAAQKWLPTTTGEIELQANTHLCVTDPDGSTVNGTQVEVKTCRNAVNQHWAI